MAMSQTHPASVLRSRRFNTRSYVGQSDPDRPDYKSIQCEHSALRLVAFGSSKKDFISRLIGAYEHPLAPSSFAVSTCPCDAAVTRSSAVWFPRGAYGTRRMGPAGTGLSHAALLSCRARETGVGDLDPRLNT